MSEENELNFGKEDAQRDPLMYVGYRVFSRWITTDQNFLIVRRFGALAARTALYLQDVVTQYEEQLDYLDKDGCQDGENPINNGTFRDDVSMERQRLMREHIPKALNNYYSFMNQYSQFVNHPRADPDAIKDVRSWFTNHTTEYAEDIPGYGTTAIDDCEMAYITEEQHHDDLVLIQLKDKSPMRLFLERTFFLRIKGLRRYFQFRRENWGKIDPSDVPDERRRKKFGEYFRWRSEGRERADSTYENTWEGKIRTFIEKGRQYKLTSLPCFETPEARQACKDHEDHFESGYTVWANDKNIDRVAAYITAFISLAMLTGPLWVLNFVQGESSRLGVITGFVGGFYILVSNATTARPSETIAAVAAYSAVLTVFLTLGASSK